MFDVLFLFPRDGDLVAVDEFLTQRLVPQLTSAAGQRSVRVSQDAIMSPGGPPPYARVLEATFDSLGDVMAVVEESKRHPAEREQLARLGPLVLLYEVTERSGPADRADLSDLPEAPGQYLTHRRVPAVAAESLARISPTDA